MAKTGEFVAVVECVPALTVICALALPLTDVNAVKRGNTKIMKNKCVKRNIVCNLEPIEMESTFKMHDMRILPSEA